MVFRVFLEPRLWCWCFFSRSCHRCGRGASFSTASDGVSLRDCHGVDDLVNGVMVLIFYLTRDCLTSFISSLTVYPVLQPVVEQRLNHIFHIFP